MFALPGYVYANCADPKDKDVARLSADYFTDECLGKLEAYCSSVKGAPGRQLTSDPNRSQGNRVNFGLFSAYDESKDWPQFKRVKKPCLVYPKDEPVCANGKIIAVKLDPYEAHAVDYCEETYGLREKIDWTGKDAAVSESRRKKALAAYLGSETRRCNSGTLKLSLTKIPAQPFGDLAVRLSFDSARVGRQRFKWNSKLQQWCGPCAASGSAVDRECWKVEREEGIEGDRHYDCGSNVEVEIQNARGEITGIAYAARGSAEMRVKPVKKPFPQKGTRIEAAAGEPLLITYGQDADPRIPGSPQGKSGALGYRRVILSFGEARAVYETPTDPRRASGLRAVDEIPDESGLYVGSVEEAAEFPSAGEHLAGCFEYGLNPIAGSPATPKSVGTKEPAGTKVK